MAAAAVFSMVDVHVSEGDTSRILNLNSQSLYEIKTVLDILPEHGIVPAGSTKPKVAFHAFQKNLAIGVGPILHLMTVYPTIKCEQSLTFTTDICAVRYLLESRLLVAFLIDGTVVFLNTLANSSQPHTRKLLSSCSLGAVVNEFLDEDRLILIATDPDGTSRIIQIPQYERLLECDARVFNEKLADSVNGASYLSDAQLPSPFTSFISSSELLSFSSTPGTSYSLSLGGDAFLETSEFMEDEVGYICVRKVGHYSVAMSRDGVLHIYDDFTGQNVKNVDLRRDDCFGDEFLSFEFLDAKVDEESFDNLKILLAVKTEGGKNEVQIRRFSDQKIEYQVKTSANVAMLPDSAGEENSIILIDPFNHKNPNSIQLRFINEAHPEMRFEKLIASGRFDDAEDFAKIYKLDIQKVHIKRAYEMINDFSENAQENQELMVKILSYCDKMTDDNAVGDICVHAVTIVPTYQCISEFLNYASKRKITDSDTASTLASRRFDLFTFAAISDCDNSFNWDAWISLMLHENAIFDLFEASWAFGEVTAARVFWNRYPKQIQDHLVQFQKLENLLDNLQKLALEHTSLLCEIIEFVQHDFGPFYILLTDDSVELQSRCNTLIEFVKNIAIGLETMDPDAFPENSLFTCGMMERMLETLRLKKTTPAHQRTLYKILGMLGASTATSSLAAGKLATRTSNLRRMLHLKNAYQCKIAYNQFTGHTVETICFVILDRCRSVQLVPKHLKELVLPYMKENGLKKDATLLEYIKRISDRASEASQQNNPWDDLCVCFAEAIDNILYRCQAVIKIAKRSSIPWSKRLKNAVNEMFKAKGISADLRRDLQAQCQTEEVLSLMIQYDMNSTFLARILNKSDLLEMLTRAFLSSSKPLVEKWEQLTRMAQLIEVINHKNMDVEFNVAAAAVISASMASIENIKSSIDNVFSMIKSEKLKRIAAETLVQRCLAILEGTQAEMVQTRSSSSEACIAAANYLPPSDKVAEILDVIDRLSRLQSEYQQTVAYSELTKYGKQVAEKRVLSFLDQEPAKTMEETVNFGELLLLGKERILALYIKHVSAQQAPGPDVFQEAISIISNSKEDLDREALVAVIQHIRQMFYMFHQYASRQHFYSNDAKGVIDFFNLLTPCMAKFAESALKLELFFEFDLLCSIQEFLSLFHEAVQCLSDMPDPDASFVATISTKEEMSAPTFVFYPAMAGMLFESVDVIKSLARVGYSVFMKSNGDDTLLSRIETTEKMDHFWEDVFTSFTSNPYLAVIARNFASKLPCMTHISADRRLTKLLIIDLCQKIVVAEKVNLHLAVSLLRSIPEEDAKDIVKKLFDWANGKQSSRAVFYVCLIAQAVAIVMGSLDSARTLYESYRDAWWCRRFAKEGILPSNVKQLDVVHKEFVSKMASPRLFEAYCKEYGCDANTQLLNYAFDLLESSSAQDDEMKFKKILETCRFIFRITTSDPHEVSLRALVIIERLCPYNYEALNLVIGQFHHWAFLSQVKDVMERADEYRTLLKFLCKNERRNDFTLQETRWYLERQKRSVNSAQDSIAFGDANDSMDFQMESDHDLLNVAERQSLLEKNYPASARKHLPFHVFLLQNKDEYEQLIGPILVNELDIQNAFLWVELIGKTNFVCSPISKTALITAAISNKVREVVSQQSELEQEEIKTIQTLLLSNKVSISILKRIAKDLNQLPLCMAKIKVLSLLHDVSQSWLQSPTVNTKDKDGISDFVYIIGVVLKKYRCEQILDEYNVVLVEKTLLDDGAALIQHLLAECIEWNDPRDIKRKMTLAREIAQIHEIPLEKSLNNVVESWLRGGESVVGYLKPVITAGQYGMNALDAAENIFPPLPYNDVDVVRMAYILHELQSVEACRKVGYHLRVENDSASNFLQRLRILCVFIRCMDNDAFKECFSCSIEDFADQLYSMILSFAFKVTQIDFKLEEYQRTPPQQIVTALVNPQSGMKQGLETFQLAAATIIDGRVADMALIERTLKRLMTYKCTPFVEMLLRYVVRLSNATFPSILPSCFAVVGDAFWESLNDEVEGYQIRDLVYFILSCPIEAGNGFKRMLNNLGHKDLIVASRMIAAANGLPPSPSSGIVARSTKDVPKINPEAMNQLGSIMKTNQEEGETEMDDADYSIQE